MMRNAVKAGRVRKKVTKRKHLSAWLKVHSGSAHREALSNGDNKRPQRFTSKESVGPERSAALDEQSSLMPPLDDDINLDKDKSILFNQNMTNK